MPDPLAVAKLLWQEAQFTSPAIALLTGIPLSSLIEQLGDRRLVAQPSKNAKIFRADDVAPLSHAEMAAILSAKPERVEKQGGHAYLIPDWREKAQPLWADPTLSARQVADAVGISPYRLTRELGARPSNLGQAKDLATGKKPNPARLEQAREMWTDPAVPVRLIADVTGIGAATLYAELGPKPGRGARQNRAKRRTKMDSKLREKARKMWDNPALTQGEIAAVLNLSVTRLRRELGFRKARYKPGKPMTAEIIEQARKMWTDPMIPMTAIVASTGITEGRLRHVLGRRPFSYRRPGPDPARLEVARKLWTDPTVTVAEIAERSGIKALTLYKALGPRGVHPRRKTATSSIPEDQLELARKLWTDPTLTVAEIAERFGIKAHVLYYALGPRGVHPRRKPKRG